MKPDSRYINYARGQDIAKSKLTDIDVVDIRSAKRQRDNMLKYIKENLSNESIAKRHGIHIKTLEKILMGKTWTHIP